jgi:hypothetical protein
MALQRGDAIPHVTVTTLNGDTFSYASVWQQHALVLVLADSAQDAAELIRRTAEFPARGAVCVVMRGPFGGLTAPAAIVADKWGECIHVSHGTSPTVDELLEWAEHVQSRCPECEGEAR